MKIDKKVIDKFNIMFYNKYVIRNDYILYFVKNKNEKRLKNIF